MSANLTLKGKKKQKHRGHTPFGGCGGPPQPIDGAEGLVYEVSIDAKRLWA